MSLRPDETWHRLLEWTYGQAPSERLAAQVLQHEGYRVDPSHPLGGPDGGKDALCERDGRTSIMAVYFPRGQQPFTATRTKLEADGAAARRNGADEIVFVTNQEVRLAERSELREAIAPLALDLYHLERVATILDKPEMAAVLKQFLHIDRAPPQTVVASITPKTQRLLDDCRKIVGFMRKSLNDVRALRAPLRRPTLWGLGSDYDPSFEQLVQNLTIEDGHLHTQLRSFINHCKRATVLLAEVERRRHFMMPDQRVRSHPLVNEQLRAQYALVVQNLEALYDRVCQRIDAL